MTDPTELRRFVPAVRFAERLVLERLEKMETKTFEPHGARLARDARQELRELRERLNRGETIH